MKEKRDKDNYLSKIAKVNFNQGRKLITEDLIAQLIAAYKKVIVIFSEVNKCQSE